MGEEGLKFRLGIDYSEDGFLPPLVAEDSPPLYASLGKGFKNRLSWESFFFTKILDELKSNLKFGDSFRLGAMSGGRSK